MYFFFIFFFFFFQAEDGIRDIGVTGVQTCALPIYTLTREQLLTLEGVKDRSADKMIAAIEASKHRNFWRLLIGLNIRYMRSEERRVGKECRYRWSPYD